MPVYENRYKTREEAPQSFLNRLLVFPRYSYMQLKGQRFVYMIFGLGWLPFLLFLVYIYLRVNVKIMESLRISMNHFPPIDAHYFFVFLIVQLPFLLFFTLIVGPQLISRDIRHKALPMILSKPVNRWEYLLGKYMVLFILLSLFTWFQGVILFISQTAVAPKASPWRELFFSENLWILPKILLFSFVVITSLNLMVMMFSALTNNHRFATAAVVMFIIGGLIIGGIASEIFHSARWMVLSIASSVVSVGYWMFGLRNETGIPPALGWASLLVFWGVCLLILSSRVKGFQLYRE